jgi:predicted nucleic acid-binding protein
MFQPGSVLFVDTAPVIYYIEDHPDFSEPVDQLVRSVQAGSHQLITSFITYVEVLTKPKREKNGFLENQYIRMMNQFHFFRIVQSNSEIMIRAVHFRAKYGLKTPDAIQLATAQVCRADAVITNDHVWKKITELHVVTLDEL